MTLDYILNQLGCRKEKGEVDSHFIIPEKLLDMTVLCVPEDHTKYFSPLSISKNLGDNVIELYEKE